MTTSAGPVGVDVETVRDCRWRRWRALVRTGRGGLAGRLPPTEQPVAFLRLWTFKEAVGKAYGVGLRGGGLRRTVGPLPALATRPRLTELPEAPGMTAVTVRLPT